MLFCPQLPPLEREVEREVHDNLDRMHVDIVDHS